MQNETKMQPGFTKGRSCQTNLIFFFDQITDFLDKGKADDLPYVDITKIYAMVPHGGITSDFPMWYH